MNNFKYNDLFRLSIFYRDQFKQIGIKKNDRIVIESKKSPDFIAALIGGWEAQAIMVPVPKYSMASKIKPKLVITRDLQFIESHQKNVENDDNIALILFTSGTTNDPKAVALSHQNIIANLDMIGSRYPGEITPLDHSFSILPWHHCYGLVCELFFLLKIGASLSVPQTGNLMKEMNQANPTLLFTVPKMIEKIYRSNIHLVPTAFLKNRSLWGNRLRMMSIGGSACNPEYLGFLKERLHIDAYQGYGLTETSPMLALNSPQYNRIGSVGTPLKNVAIKFTKTDHGHEILVKSPSLMVGYIDEVDERMRIHLPTDEEGWFKTGDCGYMDNDEFLYINGRSNAEYKLSNGKFVFPNHTEDIVLTSFRDVEQVVMLPNKEHTKNILILYTKKEKSWQSQLAQKIRNALERSVMFYELPSLICFLEEPMTIENNQLSLKMEVRRRHMKDLLDNDLIAFSVVVGNF